MPIRERILAMGPPGTGKTYQWLKMAKILMPKGVRFLCLDTDAAVTFMLETNFPELLPENKGNVYVHPAYDWPEYMAGLEWVQKEARETDWVVLDMADMAWDTVQRYFITSIFDMKKGEYFLEARRKIKERGDMDTKGKPASSVMPDAIKGWLDWPVVNSIYADFILPIAYRTKAHLYVATKAQPVTKDDDPGTKIVFGEMGIRPAGQKHLGHQVHTVFLFSIERISKTEIHWLITTVKDRANRPYFSRARLHDLYKQYLVAKAGWEIP